MARIFLLSPASSSGERMRMLLRPGARFALALEVQSRAGAPLRDVFSFASGLYFRGKQSYARRFAVPPDGEQGGLVIVPGRGLMSLEERVTTDDLHAIGQVPIDLRDARYRRPLERDASELAKRHPGAEVVLLGSVASAKYTQVLLDAFAERLLFPSEFVGRGDMSRGGLLLRCVAAGVELEYRPVKGAVVRGARPAKLPKLRGVLALANAALDESAKRQKR
jgi:hypothetical protein